MIHQTEGSPDVLVRDGEDLRPEERLRLPRFDGVVAYAQHLGGFDLDFGGRSDRFPMAFRPGVPV